MYRYLWKDNSLLLVLLLGFSFLLTGCSEQETGVEASPQVEDSEQQLEDHQDRELATIDESTESANAESEQESEDAEQAGFKTPDKEEELANSPPGDLTVHYIDVGQGDATLLQGPDFTFLIDAGRHDANDVVSYIQQQDITDLDLMVLTHPHADHIGQADKIMKTFNVKEVWMSGDEHTSKTFERVLDAVLASSADYHEPRAGETFSFGSAQLEVVNPTTLTGELHEGSISVRITYGDIRFLFTGDAEHETERDMINRDHDLQADIFQLGHHGSSTSNSQAFLDQVNPEVAIYSAKVENSYGHPHADVISRIKAMDTISIYGTDHYGHVLVTTNGVTYSIKTAKDKPKAISGPTERDAEDTAGHEKSNGCVNINLASKSELTSIIHIGDARANQLIELRPFQSVDELTRIRGISDGRLADVKDQDLACVTE